MEWFFVILPKYLFLILLTEFYFPLYILPFQYQLQQIKFHFLFFLNINYQYFFIVFLNHRLKQNAYRKSDPHGTMVGQGLVVDELKGGQRWTNVGWWAMVGAPTSWTKVLQTGWAKDGWQWAESDGGQQWVRQLLIVNPAKWWPCNGGWQQTKKRGLRQ